MSSSGQETKTKEDLIDDVTAAITCLDHTIYNLRSSLIFDLQIEKKIACELHELASDYLDRLQGIVASLDNEVCTQ